MRMDPNDEFFYIVLFLAVFFTFAISLYLSMGEGWWSEWHVQAVEIRKQISLTQEKRRITKQDAEEYVLSARKDSQHMKKPLWLLKAQHRNDWNYRRSNRIYVLLDCCNTYNCMDLHDRRMKKSMQTSHWMREGVVHDESTGESWKLASRRAGIENAAERNKSAISCRCVGSNPIDGTRRVYIGGRS